MVNVSWKRIRLDNVTLVYTEKMFYIRKGAYI